MARMTAWSTAIMVTQGQDNHFGLGTISDSHERIGSLGCQRAEIGIGRFGHSSAVKELGRPPDALLYTVP